MWELQVQGNALGARSTTIVGTLSRIGPERNLSDA